MNDAINLYRQSIELPFDRDWLDQRDNPIYPLVTAPKNVVKAYNKEYNGPSIESSQYTGSMPDIFVALVESLSPSPFYMDESFISQTSRVFTGAMYDDTYLPNLRRI